MSPARSALTEVLFSFEVGGSERLGAEIARYMSDRGIATSVCSTHGRRGPIADSLERSGIRCEALQDGSWGRLGRAIRFIRHLRRHRTTVLHVHHFSMLSVVHAPARLAGVRRIVVTEHSDHQVRKSRSNVRSTARYGRRADLVTAVHHDLAELLDGLIKDPDGSVQVIPNGVDTERFSPKGPQSSHPGGGGGPFTIGVVGRLHPDKDPMNLLRALRIAREDRDEELHVRFVGDGELRGELEAYVASHDLAGRVEFLGTRDDVADLLRELDAVVLPSKTEGLPMALLEAMSTGLPVVATAVGGVPAALADCGILVPPENPDELARAIDRLRADRALCDRLGAKARRRAVSEYDVSMMYRRYAEALFPGDDTGADAASGVEVR